MIRVGLIACSALLAACVYPRDDDEPIRVGTVGNELVAIGVFEPGDDSQVDAAFFFATDTELWRADCDVLGDGTDRDVERTIPIQLQPGYAAVFQRFAIANLRWTGTMDRAPIEEICVAPIAVDDCTLCAYGEVSLPDDLLRCVQVQAHDIDVVPEGSDLCGWGLRARP